MEPILLRVMCVCSLFSVVYLQNVTNCRIPKCEFYLREQPAPNTMHYLNETMETKMFGLFLFLMEPYTDSRCYVDTKEFIDAFNFDTKPVYAVLVFLCYKDVEVYFTDDHRPFLPNVMSYLQIKDCTISQEQLYPIQNRFKIFMVNFYTKYPSLDMKYCDGEPIHRNSCKVWNTLEGITYMPKNLTNSVKSIKELFYCNTTFPYMKEINFVKFPMKQYLSQLPSMFPRLQVLSIENSDLMQPPDFPWSDVWLHLSFNMSRTDTEHYEFAEIFHIQVPNDMHMKTMSLSKNQITDLSNHTFRGFLHKLDLSRNGLHTISNDTFRNLRGFQYLDLSFNELVHVPTDSFKGLNELRHLDFKNNHISYLSSDHFSDNLNLVYLDFSGNKISNIEQNTFSHLRLLRELHLEYNKIAAIHANVFPSRSIEFKKLILDGNGFSEVPEVVFSLQLLEKISLKNTNAKFKNFTQTILDFTRNPIQDGVNNETTVENQNFVVRQPIDDKHSVILDLTGSKIDNLEIPNYEVNEIKSKEIEQLHQNLLLVFKTFKFILEDNPLRCDCRINQISKVLNFLIKDNILEADKSFDWKCQWPAEFESHSLLEVPEKDTYCEKNIPLCPFNCSCYERSLSNITIVDCRNRGFRSLPKMLPSGSLDLWFHQNNITTLSNRIYLNHIRSFYLSHNSLAQIESSVFRQLKNLQELFLNFNFLVSLPSEIQDYFSGKLNIEDNPFKCDCNTVWLKHWMLNKPNITINSQKVTCNVDKEHENGRQFLSVPDNEFVCLENFDSYNKVLVPSVIASVVLVLMIITICLMYIYRLEIKVLLYIYLGFHPFDQDKDCKEIVDVLVVHSPAATKWVMENVVEYLEFSSAHYLVCEMMRDFVAGFSYQENIATLVKHSKRIVIVLSKEFINDDILKIAWNETQEKIKALKTNYAIVVSYDVNLKEIPDKDLQQYIKRGRYIDANQSFFQEKLLYCMPQLTGDDMRVKSLPDLKYLIQNMYGNDVTDAEMYERHAFLSYCESDMGYVMNELRPIIEDNGFTLCLPDRDFIPGAPKEENVLKAIDNCLHTIFLLSGEQLDNEWSVFTFRSASEKSMREKCNHLIVVLGDDVNVETMGEEVRAYVKTHVSLKVSEKGFIRRLLNALPDIENHELYIKHDDNNFVDFENLHKTKMEDGLSRIVADMIENEEKKNGIQIQNGKMNGHVQLTDIHLNGTQHYQNRAFQKDETDVIDINENERKKQ